MRGWRLRVWARAVALVLLAASARLPHLNPDDQACAPLFAGTSAGDAALTDGVGATGQHEHCAICHWTRLLRSPLTVSSAVAVTAARPSLVSQRAVLFTAAPADDHLPARAPPATLL